MRAAFIEECGRPPRVAAHRAVRRDGDAVVAVTAAPITPLDVLCATGTSYLGRPALPYVPGAQGVGVVEEARGLAPGTRVWFPTDAGMRPGDGSMAGRCAVPESDLVVLPAEVDDRLTAALGLSAVAAWAALTWRAGFRRGEQVVVLGAGGVVGQVAAQAARLLGARRVVCVCRPGAAAERATAAGADAVVTLVPGEDASALAERLSRELDGGADVVVDPVFGVPATAAARLLAPHGRLVNLGGSAGDGATFESSVLRGRAAAVLGYTNNDLTAARKGEVLREVLTHAAAGRLRVAFEAVPLDDVADAWSRQARGEAESRLVVVP
ncbi:zinc-binding dehydrogenase [Sphaerisporangium rubeum]|uniref:NADPH:quinone reductase-like Zn-dependent oxidoreductase n=1 Tax=Sphaerisporangium rubeum TaxID=321317 RepID=A0A7X0M8B3_9ACTN|nr:zinc-binding dehydrogenase [Sphaerisporangium rubeum]MBB6475653.1 NADPH:quinone reductase-like Zn-dependent oxidoreductase [Sphaerisporangium rubeum]